MPPSDVVLTIDTEFSIAGAFTDPSRFKPVGPQSVLGALADEEHGLGFILGALKRHGGTATFFVEVMNTAYFGLEPMGAIARRILDAGHDVQLHVHPCWTAFDAGPFVRQPGAKAPNDSCSLLERDRLEDLLTRAIEVFASWGIPRPVALRTGSFSTSRDVYRAQASLGLPLASNVCVAVEPPAEPELRVVSGRHLIEGVVEIPTLSFVDRRTRGGDHLRPLQITAVSAAEIRLVLERAREAGVDPVVATTHAFEYFKHRGMDYHAIRPNRINQRRLDAFCSHVSRHPERFRWATFGGSTAAWTALPTQANAKVLGSVPLAFLRMAENAVNDRVWLL